METQSSCRVCMKNEINLFDIFAKPFGANGPPSLAEILTKLTKYKVEKDDQLSHKICAECLKWGRSSHRFCTTAEESYYTASQILGINSNPIQTNQADQNGDSQIEANEQMPIPEILTTTHNSNANETNNTNPEPLEKKNASTDDLIIKIEDQECSDSEYFQECNTNSANLKQIKSPRNDLVAKIKDSESSNSAIAQDPSTNDTNYKNSRQSEKRNSSANHSNNNLDDLEYPANGTVYDQTSNNNVEEEELNTSSASQGQHELIQDDGTVSYICTICREIFETLFSLQKHRIFKHLRTSKNPGISYDCRICGFSNNTKRGLGSHLKFAHKFEFDLDEEVEESVVHHDQPHDTRVLENITQLDLKCSRCNKKYSIPSELQHHILYRHLDQHNEDISGDASIGDGNISNNTLNISLECNICNESFDTMYLLQKHRVVSHLRVPEHFVVEIGVNYDCKICSWSFGRKTSIVHHLRTFHHNKGNIDLDVEKSKIINEKYNDNRLLENITPLDKTCCTCTKKFPDLFELKKHILYTHVRLEKMEKVKQNLSLSTPNKAAKPIKTAKPAAQEKVIPEPKWTHPSGEFVDVEEERLSIRKDNFLFDNGNNSFDDIFSPLKMHSSSKQYRNSTPKATISKKRGSYKKKNALLIKALHNPKSDEIKENVCTICDNSFASLFDLQKHRFVTHLRIYKKNAKHKTIFICPICGYDYGTRSTFQVHLKEFHKKDDDLSDEIKAARFGKLENWNDMRLLDNITDIDLNCIPCGRQFKEPILLKYHVLYSHLQPTDLTSSIESSITNQDEILGNDTEEISETTSSNVVESEELQPIIKVEAEEMCVEPNVCIYNSLNETINKNGADLTRRKSERSSKNVNLKRSLADGQENDKTTEVGSGSVQKSKRLKRVYECEVCLKSFQAKYILNKHFATAHKELKLHECPLCYKKFNHQKLLTSHINNLHYGSTFSCEECSLEFRTVYKLSVHKRVAHFMATQDCVLNDEINMNGDGDDDNEPTSTLIYNCSNNNISQNH